jgi:hypothetical protein
VEVPADLPTVTQSSDLAAAVTELPPAPVAVPEPVDDIFGAGVPAAAAAPTAALDDTDSPASQTSQTNASGTDASEINPSDASDGFENITVPTSPGAPGREGLPIAAATVDSPLAPPVAAAAPVPTPSPPAPVAASVPKHDSPAFGAAAVTADTSLFDSMSPAAAPAPAPVAGTCTLPPPSPPLTRMSATFGDFDALEPHGHDAPSSLESYAAPVSTSTLRCVSLSLRQRNFCPP